MNSENEEPKIIFKQTGDNSVLDIQLNDPTKLNALSEDMMIELARIIGSFSQPSKEQYKGFIPIDISPYTIPMPKIVFLRGHDKAFCSGGNITNIYDALNEGKHEGITLGYQAILTLIQMLYFMKPIQVSIWTGWVMGGGVGISINSPIRIATENTVFSMPECQIGLYPDVGGPYFLTHLLNNNPSLGLYVGLTGYRIKGKDCVITGIATHYVPQNDLESIQDDIRKLCSEKEIVTLEDIKSVLSSKAISYNKADFKFENEDIINKVFILDDIYKIMERLKTLLSEGNDREKKFAGDTLKVLERSSALSLLIYTELCKKAIHYEDICEEYRTDFNVAVKTIINGEFKEGIRATLIDRDKKYNWKYKSVNDIREPQKIIDGFINSVNNHSVQP